MKDHKTMQPNNATKVGNNSEINKERELRAQYEELFQNADLYKYGFADDIIDNILMFTDDAPLEYIKGEYYNGYSRLSWYPNTTSKFYDKHMYAIHAYLFEKKQDYDEELFDMSEYRFDLWQLEYHIIKLFEKFIDLDLEDAALYE